MTRWCSRESCVVCPSSRLKFSMWLRLATQLFAVTIDAVYIATTLTRETASFFKFVSSLGGRMDLCRSRLCFFNIAEDFDKHAPRRDAEMGFSTDSPNRQRQIDEERDRDFKWKGVWEICDSTRGCSFVFGVDIMNFFAPLVFVAAKTQNLRRKSRVGL